MQAQQPQGLAGMAPPSTPHALAAMEAQRRNAHMLMLQSAANSGTPGAALKGHLAGAMAAAAGSGTIAGPGGGTGVPADAMSLAGLASLGGLAGGGTGMLARGPVTMQEQQAAMFAQLQVSAVCVYCSIRLVISFCAWPHRHRQNEEPRDGTSMLYPVAPRWCSAQLVSHCVLLQQTCYDKVQGGLAVPVFAVFSLRNAGTGRTSGTCRGLRQSTVGGAGATGSACSDSGTPEFAG